MNFVILVIVTNSPKVSRLSVRPRLPAPVAGRGRYFKDEHPGTIELVGLGAFFAPQKTGLSAPIFAPEGQKFRFYPLRS
jgi:hypothetical protein